MNNKLILLFFCLSLNPVLSMYVTPNDIVVNRGDNYTFEAVASISFIKYSVVADYSGIPFNTRRNSTNIQIDYVVPSIMKLRVYHFYIYTFDENNYQLENVTYRFVIGNLTDVELFNLFEENEILGDTNQGLQDDLVNATNITSGWEDYIPPTSFFEANFNYVITIVSTFSICLSLFGVLAIRQKHVANEIAKEERRKKKLAKKNYAQAQLTKQAVSHNMDIFISQNIDKDTMQIPLLNEWERESVKKYHKYCDATFFLRPTPEISKKLGIEDLSSINVIYYRLKENLKEKDIPDYTEWWYVVSAIVRYLQEKGFIKKDNAIFPVRCSLDDIKIELGKIYDKKEEQDLKLLKDKETKESDTQKEFKKATKKPKGAKSSKKEILPDQIDVEERVRTAFDKK